MVFGNNQIAGQGLCLDGCFGQENPGKDQGGKGDKEW
jgi:hypothetical protein